MAAYDAIIIGTGQAGPRLARRVAGTGMAVAIIERGRFGGICVNTGCPPTKTLVASAYALHVAHRGAECGFSAARAAVPDLPGIEQVPYLTNSSMVDVDFVPRHLLILGSSYIALEFGQMYRRFGSAVTIVARGPRLVSREDADVSAAITEVLTREGIAVRCNAQCLRVGRQGDDIVMTVNCGGTSELHGSHLLVATGRRPDTNDLGLDRAGVKRDAHGYIVVDDELRTSVPGIWALGDCNGKGAFTHTSWNDYQIVAANFDNLFDGGTRRVSDRIPAYALYTDPPLGRVGMSEAEVRSSGRPALIGTIAMEDVSRAFEKARPMVS